MVYLKWHGGRFWTEGWRELDPAGVVVGMAGKEAACPACWPELAPAGAALSTRGGSSTSSAGSRGVLVQGGTETWLVWHWRSPRHEASLLWLPQTVGHWPGMQPMVLNPVHANTVIPLEHLLASTSSLLTAQECPGQQHCGCLLPRFLGAACPGGALAAGAAALLLTRDGGAAFTPSAGMLSLFRLALLPENREGLNYEDLEHASFHGVAKDICLSTL